MTLSVRCFLKSVKIMNYLLQIKNEGYPNDWDQDNLL